MFSASPVPFLKLQTPEQDWASSSGGRAPDNEAVGLSYFCFFLYCLKRLSIALQVTRIAACFQHISHPGLRPFFIISVSQEEKAAFCLCGLVSGYAILHRLELISHVLFAHLSFKCYLE